MIQIVRVFKYNWVYAQACHNQSKIIAMVYSQWLLLVFLKIIYLNWRDTVTLNVCISIQMLTHSTVSSFTERNIKITHTHIDGKKGIIEDLEEDIV